MGAISDLLEETLESLINVSLPPSRVLIVCPDGFEIKLQDAYNSRKRKILDRFRTTTHIVLAKYDVRGRLIGEPTVLFGAGTSWTITDSMIHHVAKMGVARLVEHNRVILKAPHGYLYKKPSGEKSVIFARAGNVLREPDCLSVFLPLMLKHTSSDCRRIYIDSSTILPFAMELQRSLSYFAARCDKASFNEPVIKNFKSYLGLDSLSLDTSEDHVILISASSSGGLATKLISEYGASSDKIVHLIGVNPKRSTWELKDTCIYFRDFEKDHGGLHRSKEIHIVGEEFIISPSNSIPVRIGHPHIGRQLAKRFSDPFYKDRLKIMRKAETQGHAGYSLFSIADDQAIGPPDFLQWLEDQVLYSLPPSVAFIVYQGDSGSRSKLLAEKVASVLSDRCGLKINAEHMCSVDDLGSNKVIGSLPSQHSVLVVAAEDPSLQAFQTSSRFLRDSGQHYRHYLIGYAFPATFGQYCRARDDLVQHSKSTKYGWSEYSVAAVGPSSVHESWWVERRTFLNAERLEVLTGIKSVASVYRRLIDRLDRFESGEVFDSDQIFLPTIEGGDLSLTVGSVFFDNDYDPVNVSAEMVYLMVSSGVQSAREGRSSSSKSLDEAFRFDRNPFVSSVIDPVMFSRFSDGMLQASLLRCLSAEELDYTRNLDLSSQMRDILVSAIEAADTGVGEAVLEFMFALATKKVALVDDDYALVVDQIEGDNRLSRIWKLFLSRSSF